ncbi:MAG TPA: DUF6064 family protein [Albitalea sp.]|nr:DUF6064 family protein [Albitalea sp.]
MSEWWTYHPSSFLMFSPRTYWRLFELANAAAWPWQWVAVGVGIAGWAVRWRELVRPRVAANVGWARWSALYLAVCCAWSGWAFLHRLYADINWPADGLAAGFAVQALGLAATAAFVPLLPVAPRPRWTAGMTLVGWALMGQPLLGLALGRPLSQIEMIGIAPDPTMIAMLGWLTLVHAPSRSGRVILRCLWAIPLLACAASAATLWTMGSVQAWVLPIALAVAAAGVRTRATDAARPLQTRPAPPPLRS